MLSQVIQASSYDERSRTLFITFTSGELYAYLDVPPRVFADLRAAPSRGRYFAYKIRSRYLYRRMTDDDGEPEGVMPPGAPSWPPPAAAERSA